MKQIINISSNGIKQAIDDLVNENELLQDKIYKQNEEIERLKEELEYTIPIVEPNKKITKHLKEIERLNNIIKKLEEFIERKIELYTIELTEENERKLSIVAPIKGVYKEIYNVLQELKGSDKE